MADQVVQSVRIDILQANPFQPRNRIKPEDIAELADSIKMFGVLEPLIVAETPAGMQIIAGERRWRAARQAGLTEVPVIVKVTTPREMLELALIENVQREDLGALERAQAFAQLKRDFNHSISEIAESISKSVSYVSNTLRLLSLPDAIKDGLAGGLISEGHARALGGLPPEDTPTMIKIYKQVLLEEASVRRTEELVRDYKTQHTTSALRKPRTTITRGEDPAFQEWQAKLQRVLKAKAEGIKIKLTRSHRQSKLIITIKGDLDRTQAVINKLMDMTSNNPEMTALEKEANKKAHLD